MRIIRARSQYLGLSGTGGPRGGCTENKGPARSTGTEPALQIPLNLRNKQTSKNARSRSTAGPRTHTPGPPRLGDDAGAPGLCRGRLASEASVLATPAVGASWWGQGFLLEPIACAHKCLCMYVCIYIYMYTHIHIQCIHVYVHPSIYLSVRASSCRERERERERTYKVFTLIGVLSIVLSRLPLIASANPTFPTQKPGLQQGRLALMSQGSLPPTNPRIGPGSPWGRGDAPRTQSCSSEE